MCRFFERRWAERESRVELLRAHSYALGGDDSPHYPRWERFMKAKPRAGVACKCGGDKRKCWSRVYSRLLLGEGRTCR